MIGGLIEMIGGLIEMIGGLTETIAGPTLLGEPLHQETVEVPGGPGGRRVERGRRGLRGEPGGQVVGGEILEREDLHPGVMVVIVMMIAALGDLQDVLLTVMFGDVVVREGMTDLHQEEEVETLDPVDLPLHAVTTQVREREMKEHRTGVKVLLVESVAPRLEMKDPEIDQLVIKMTAGRRSNVNPDPVNHLG